MNQDSDRSVLITGANTGIGKEVARQLALSGQYKKIYLACRNAAKAKAAQKDLEEKTAKTVFEVLIMDVSDLTSVRSAAASLKSGIDTLIMNAGGMGGKTPLARTKDGVTQIFASNVLGHAVLLEELIKSNKLRKDAILVGSEAARGVPKLGIKRPALATSSADEFASLCDGSYFDGHKFDQMLAYAQVKYVGAMWMSSMARKNPNLKLITVSPGNTSGTEVPRDFPFAMRLMMQYVLPAVGPLLGIVHKVEIGARRLVDSIDDESLKSGGFYASAAKTLTGALMEQSEIFPDLANPRYQNDADEAVHRFG